MISYRSLIYRNFSWLFFDKLFHIIVGLIIAVWVARYLGPKNYGVLNYAIAYTSFFTIFVKIGLDKIIVREIVKNNAIASVYIGTGFFIKLIGSLLAITLISLSVVLFEKNNLVKLTILLVSISFIFQAFDVIDFYYQSLMQSKYVVISKNLSFFITNMIKIFFIIKGYSVIYFAILLTFEIFLSSLFLILSFKITGNKIALWRFDRNITKSLLKDSWPIAFNAFLISIHTRIDQVMIKSLINLEQLGIFSVAVKIAEYWYFIPVIIVQTLMPYFVKLKQINIVVYENRLIQLYSIMFWIGVIVGIGSILLGKFFITMTFGVDYIDSYRPLIFNIWKGIFVSQAIASTIWVINENVQLYRLYVNVLAILTNIALNFVLIPKEGITGAAIASLVSIGLSTWVYSLFFSPLKKPTLAMIKSIMPAYLFRRRCESVL
jgi:O-antigen/teichoic acid export membrane protein